MPPTPPGAENKTADIVGDDIGGTRVSGGRVAMPPTRVGRRSVAGGSGQSSVHAKGQALGAGRRVVMDLGLWRLRSASVRARSIAPTVDPEV
jgi:hypothetical protein